MNGYSPHYSDGTGGYVRLYIAFCWNNHGFIFSTCFSGRMSYSGWGTPISHLSNQPTIEVSPHCPQTGQIAQNAGRLQSERGHYLLPGHPLRLAGAAVTYGVEH